VKKGLRAVDCFNLKIERFVSVQNTKCVTALNYFNLKQISTTRKLSTKIMEIQNYGRVFVYKKDGSLGSSLDIDSNGAVFGMLYLFNLVHV